MKTFSPHDFTAVTRFLKARSGIALAANKAYLLEARIAPLLIKYKLKSSADFSRELLVSKNSALIEDFVECMTTNETLFFRDQKPFELIENDVLPHLKQVRADRKRIRIWCAAASTGQEPYSLAMLFNEQRAQWQDWKIDIVASDISRAAVAKAQRGVYSQFEVQRGMPIRLLMKYFTQEGNDWVIAPEIRSAVSYHHHNLLEGSDRFGAFDLILIRNVLIYFDIDLKKQVIERTSKAMASDGYLILGAAETTLHYSPILRPVKPEGGLYIKATPAEAEAANGFLSRAHALAARTAI
jgi:chemotaxis protein methyltransferase CheR